jgi:PAS domain S-box-containing protein
MSSGTVRLNYRAAFEAIPGCNILLLPDEPVYSIEAVSDETLKLMTTTREDVQGSSIFNLALEIFSVLREDELRSLLKSSVDNKTTNFIRARIPDGNRSHGNLISLTSKPILNEDGTPSFLLLSISSFDLGDTQRSGQVEFPHNFFNIIHQAPVAMGILKGEDMVLEIANDQMLALWGKSRDIIGLPILEGLPEIKDQPFPKLLEEVYRTGQSYNGYETPAYIRHGNRLALCYFNFVYAPLKDWKGRINGIMMVAAEVTNLVKAKKDLEESEKRYRDLISNATVATAVYVGENMVIRLANEAMLKLWGKTGSVIGRPLSVAVPELEGQPFRQLLHQVYTSGITYHSKEDRADLVIDGRLQSFYFNFTYKALRDSEGKIYGILNMAVDVSDLVRARMEIIESEKRWRVALQSAELGTWDYYPKTGQFFCSRRTKELFGLPADSSPTFENILAAIHRKDRHRVRKTLGRALTKGSGGQYRSEYGVTGIHDKRERWQRATGQVFFDDDGNPTRVTGTVLDITERKRVEEALEERVMQRTKELTLMNKELERSNFELEQYAYVASHDLQEPLRKILVYADLLKNNMANGTIESSRVQKVMASAQRMSALIRDLLNFSKLLKTERIFSEVDLNQVLKNVLDDFELKISETSAWVTLEELPVVEASPQQMNQLFYNLISNSLKFRNDQVKAEIVIRARLLDSSEVSQYPELVPSMTYYDITVADNGIGFNPKYERQIFEVFKRLHTRVKYEGTGIGLALCRKIARNHGGEIFAQSVEGHGSEFHVLLPKQQM